jgi:hypothetical protein
LHNIVKLMWNGNPVARIPLDQWMELSATKYAISEAGLKKDHGGGI